MSAERCPQSLPGVTLSYPQPHLHPVGQTRTQVRTRRWRPRGNGNPGWPASPACAHSPEERTQDSVGDTCPWAASSGLSSEPLCDVRSPPFLPGLPAPWGAATRPGGPQALGSEKRHGQCWEVSGSGIPLPQPGSPPGGVHPRRELGEMSLNRALTVSFPQNPAPRFTPGPGLGVQGPTQPSPADTHPRDDPCSHTEQGACDCA